LKQVHTQDFIGDCFHIKDKSSFDIESIRAKGYTNMFLVWQDEALCKVLDQSSFYTRRNAKNRNKFIKLSEDLVKFGIKDCTFNHLIGGSKRHPFIMFIEYSDGNFTHSNFEERVVFLSSRFFPFNRRGLISPSQPITISKHAIDRVFKRSGLIDLNSSKLNLFNPGKSLNEMKYISLWANMWSIFQRIFTKCAIELEDIQTIPIPGESGIFLAKYTRNQNGDGFHINVRTYYGHEQLENKNLTDFHKKLKQISLNLENSLICWPEASSIAKVTVTLDITIFMLRFKKIIDEIISFIVEDKTTQSIIKNNFHKFIFNDTLLKHRSRYTPEVLEDSSNILNDLGYPEYLSATMKYQNLEPSLFFEKLQLLKFSNRK